MRIGELSDSYYFVSTVEAVRKITRVLRENAELSLDEFRVLGRLSTETMGMGQSAIAKSLDVPRSAVSMDVAKLAEKGLIRRFYDEAGRRTVSAQITARGDRELQRAEVDVDAVYLDVVGGLPKGDRATTDRYMLMMIDDMGALPFVDGDIDTTLVFVEICSRSKQIVTRVLRRFGLSVADYCILNELADAEGGMRPVQLCERLHMRRPDVTTCCKKLEGAGRIVRSADPSDRRGVMFSITREGARFFAEVRAIYQNEFLDKVRNLTPREEQFFFNQVNRLASKRS